MDEALKLHQNPNIHKAVSRKKERLKLRHQDLPLLKTDEFRRRLIQATLVLFFGLNKIIQAPNLVLHSESFHFHMSIRFPLKLGSKDLLSLPRLLSKATANTFLKSAGKIEACTTMQQRVRISSSLSGASVHEHLNRCTRRNRPFSQMKFYLSQLCCAQGSL